MQAAVRLKIFTLLGETKYACGFLSNAHQCGKQSTRFYWLRDYRLRDLEAEVVQGRCEVHMGWIANSRLYVEISEEEAAVLEVHGS